MILKRSLVLLLLFPVIGLFWLAVTSSHARDLASIHADKYNPWSKRENAVFVTLCRNKELKGMLSSISDVERQFNKRFHYDWVFLNDQPWDEEFKTKVTAAVSGKAFFGEVPTEHWSYPEWIDQDKARETRKQMKAAGVLYGDSESYRHMCRFQAGFFFKHPLMQPYRYYWRVEPGIEIKCSINYDVFTLMRQGGYKYGWNVAPKDIPETVSSLWEASVEFLNNQTQYIAENNLAGFISDDDLETYNLCHFWSNFEIADAEFFRSEAYQQYFEHLDHAGGFFYERWGDAPVHSIAASLFLDQDEIHFFNDVGYFHSPYGHCPIDQGLNEITCDCHPESLEYSDAIYDWHKNSCVRNYLKAKQLPFTDGNPELQ